MTIFAFLNMRIILFISYFIFAMAMLPAQITNDEPDPSVFIPGVRQPREINMGDITKQSISVR